MLWSSDGAWVRSYDSVLFREVLSGIKDLKNLTRLTMSGGERFSELWIIEKPSKIAAAKTLRVLTIPNFKPNYKELGEMPYVLPTLEVVRFAYFDKHELPVDKVRGLLKGVAPRLRVIQ